MAAAPKPHPRFDPTPPLADLRRAGSKFAPPWKPCRRPPGPRRQGSLRLEIRPTAGLRLHRSSLDPNRLRCSPHRETRDHPERRDPPGPPRFRELWDRTRCRKRRDRARTREGIQLRDRNSGPPIGPGSDNGEPTQNERSSFPATRNPAPRTRTGRHPN